MNWSTAEWTAADWATCVIFISVATIGIKFWIRYFRLPELHKARFLFDESANVRWGLIDVLIIAFVWLASQALTLQAFAAWHGIAENEKVPGDLLARFGVINGIVQIVIIGLSLLYLIGRYGHDEAEFGFEKGKWLNGIKFGLIAFAMWVPLVWAVQTVLVMFIDYSHPSFERIKQSHELRPIIDTWIAAVLVAPIVEEILFRGIIQGWIQRWRKDARANPNALILGGATQDNRVAKKRPNKKPSRTLHLPAILITSVLFGLAHRGQGPAPISLFVLSLGLGFLYQRTGSLVACIAMHMLLNAVTMVLFSIDLYTN